MEAEHDDLTSKLRAAAEREQSAKKATWPRRITQIRRVIRLTRMLADEATDDVLWGMIERATRWGEEKPGPKKPGPIGKALFSICGRVPITVAIESYNVTQPRCEVLSQTGFEAEVRVRHAVLVHRDGGDQWIPLGVESVNGSGDYDAMAASVLASREPRPAEARRQLGWLLNNFEKWLAEYEKNPGIRPWGVEKPKIKLGEGVFLTEDGEGLIEGPMTPERMIPVLLGSVERFLARLESLDRNDDGSYRVGESNDKRTRGAWVLWENVQMLAGWVGASAIHTPPGHTMGFVEPKPGALPIDEAARSMQFVLIKPKGGHWPATIPAEKVEKIKALRDELALYVGATSAAVVPKPEQAEATGGGKEDKLHDPSHSDDFSSVNWYGTRYTFSKGNQCESVRVLWDEWEKGGHALKQETIGEKIGSSASKFELRKVFRSKDDGGKYHQHPAWGTMIQSEEKGCYRLVEPE